MTPDDVRLLVQALEARPSPVPSLMPGTVTNVDRLNDTVTVQMDGQEWGDDIDVRPLVADLARGDRVMVQYDPPRGGYVVGWVARPYSAGETVAYAQATENLMGVSNAAEVTWTSTTVTFYGGRRYRIEYGGQAIRNSGNPRAQLKVQLVTDDPASTPTTPVPPLVTQLQSASVCLPASDYCDNLSKAVLFDPAALPESLGFDGGNVQGTLRLQAHQIRSSGGGTANFIASATSPAYLMVTDAGPRVS